MKEKDRDNDDDDDDDDGDGDVNESPKWNRWSNCKQLQQCSQNKASSEEITRTGCGASDAGKRVNMRGKKRLSGVANYGDKWANE